MRLPSAVALQRAAVAATAGAGVALVGLSVSGFSGLDSNLAAATQQQVPALHQDHAPRALVGRSIRDCHRGAQPTQGGDDATTSAHQPT